MSDLIASLRGSGLLEAIDVAVADMLVRRANADDVVALAVALTSAAQRAGHVCLDLQRPWREIFTEREGDANPPEIAAAAVLTALRASPLCARSDENRDSVLVLDAKQRLYFRRAFDLENRVAARLVALCSSPRIAPDPAWLASRLDHYFDAASADQRRAAAIACERQLCVITGGPGTGKTSTVVKLLAVHAEAAHAANRRAPTVLLLAPTGKAAARLGESIDAALERGALPESIAAVIPRAATTLHRALQVRPDGSGPSRRRDRPLAADIVVVDEASMVDLEMMAMLVDALAHDTQLVLLGDRHQLASVEAGAVLADICAARALAPAVAELTTSRRFDAGGTIGKLADAIRRGDVDEALSLLRARSGVALETRRARRGGANSAADLAVRGYLPYLRATDEESALEALASFRLLCAHRRGPNGVDDLNRTIERRLLAEGVLRRHGDLIVGRPILITRNDAAVGLANGDIGLTYAERSATALDAAPTIRVVFARSGTTPRRLSPSRLPPHEPVYAMTVHKSQGSEANQVVVALPDEISPVMTRELLYTAVTRARQSVTLCGDPEIIARAIRTPVTRRSGLRDAIDGER